MAHATTMGHIMSQFMRPSFVQAAADPRLAEAAQYFGQHGWDDPLKRAVAGDFLEEGGSAVAAPYREAMQYGGPLSFANVSDYGARDVNPNADFVYGSGIDARKIGWPGGNRDWWTSGVGAHADELGSPLFMDDPEHGMGELVFLPSRIGLQNYPGIDGELSGVADYMAYVNANRQFNDDITRHLINPDFRQSERGRYMAGLLDNPPPDRGRFINASGEVF